jgi:hypothetical protein
VPADSLFAATFTNARSILGTAEVRGHAWVPVLGPGTPSHTANPIWAYNSSGGPIKVTRNNTGNYDVLFTGLAGSTEGHALVTATGSSSSRCRAAFWDNIGPDQRVRVFCRTAAGSVADAEFAIQFVW